MREIIFVFIALLILGSIFFVYIKNKNYAGVLFIASLFVLAAFYMLQWGSLSSFSINALSVGASFIKEKRAAVVNDVKAIAEMKTQSEKDRKEIEQVKSEILALKKEIDKTTELASPPSLILTGKIIKPIESGYEITLQFTPSKNAPMGMLEFIAAIDDKSNARILNMWPDVLGGAFEDNSRKVESNGKRAMVSYSLLSVGKPTFNIRVSGKAEIKIEGNYLDKPIIFEIK